MNVYGQALRGAAQAYVPQPPHRYRSLIALLITLLFTVLSSSAPDAASASANPVPAVVTVSQPKTVADPGSFQRALSKDTLGAHTVFLPMITGAQPGEVPSPAGLAIGIYQPQGDTSGGAIDRYVTQIGKKPAFAWLPMTWQRLDGSYRKFDPQMLEEFRTRGIMPGLTWEPSKGPIESYTDRQVAINQTDFSWQQIISGRYDSYITEFARDAAAYQYPVLLRVLHEMNGTWYPWGCGVNGNTNLADFVSAYKHIVDLFRAAGATNVQFVWNPSVNSATLISRYGDTLEQLYPGETYVDWVALDGYNNKLDDWRSLQSIFEPSYQLITSFSRRPMILFEVGTLENPQDPMARANWITQGFLTTIPSQFPAVKLAVWFNSEDGSGRNFSLDTPNALNAWKQVVFSPLYQGRLLK